RTQHSISRDLCQVLLMLFLQDAHPPYLWVKVQSPRMKLRGLAAQSQEMGGGMSPGNCSFTLPHDWRDCTACDKETRHILICQLRMFSLWTSLLAIITPSLQRSS
ncbi:hypothetical protein J0S82_008483, partial [Galemys pyrenaicus]